MTRYTRLSGRLFLEMVPKDNKESDDRTVLPITLEDISSCYRITTTATNTRLLTGEQCRAILPGDSLGFRIVCSLAVLRLRR